MKILVFYPYLPYPLDRGTYQRTFHLLRELAGHHEVDLLAMDEGGDGVAHKDVFEKFCRRVEVVPFVHPPWQKLFPHRLLNPLPPNVAHWTVPAAQKKLDEMLAAEKYDAIHVCDIVLMQYLMSRDLGIPIVMDRSRVDLQFQLAEHNRMKFPLRTRLLRTEGYFKLWRFERAVARRVAAEVVCGLDDEIFIHRWISHRAPVTVLINGVDLEFFFPTAADEPRAPEPTLLFCGAMDYSPNIDALRWFFSDLHAPLLNLIPNLKVLIVGKNPTPEVQGFGSRTGVVVTGGVPDVRPYYRRAWMQMVPLRIGGGSRLKIVESLAMGTPVVSTTIGAQGLGLVHDSDILLADNSEAFLAQTVRGLGDIELRKRLRVAGLETVCSRLSWKTLGQQLNSIYSRLFSHKTVPIPQAQPALAP